MSNRTIYICSTFSQLVSAEWQRHSYLWMKLSRRDSDQDCCWLGKVKSYRHYKLKSYHYSLRWVMWPHLLSSYKFNEYSQLHAHHQSLHATSIRTKTPSCQYCQKAIRIDQACLSSWPCHQPVAHLLSPAITIYTNIHSHCIKLCSQCTERTIQRTDWSFKLAHLQTIISYSEM